MMVREERVVIIGGLRVTSAQMDRRRNRLGRLGDGLWSWLLGRCRCGSRRWRLVSMMTQGFDDDHDDGLLLHGEFITTFLRHFFNNDKRQI
jgi:hypothetical protein